MKNFFDNLEIYLTFAGLGVIFLAAALLHQFGYWQILGTTAVAVGVVHGFLFWAIRRRQRRVRQELIVAMRLMLADRINNNLTVLLSVANELQDEDPATARHVADEYRSTVESAMLAAREISATIDRLSLDSLRHWQRHYRLNAL